MRSFQSDAVSDQASGSWLVALDAPRRHVSHKSQHRVLKIVFLEGIAAAQAALIRVDGLGGGIIVSSIEGYEARSAIAAVNFQRAAGVGRT